MTDTTQPAAGDLSARAGATVDVVILGAGPAGENVADRVARGGLTVAVVERELVGGECSYWACMPTKALLRDAAALRAARALPGSVRGHGRITGTRTVTVEGLEGGTSTTTTLHARHAVVIATGSSAHIPPIPGLADVAPWTSREAAAARKIPRRLAIIGGGVVGSEMATAYSALGSRVALISRTGLLPTVEQFAGEQVAGALRTAGVELHLNVDATEVMRDESGTVAVTLSDGTVVIADQVLLATGRSANTRDIGLDDAGLTPGSRVAVDDALAVLDGDGKPVGDDTATGWLFAVGDVNQRAPLTHHGKYQARALGDAIAARATTSSTQEIRTREGPKDHV